MSRNIGQRYCYFCPGNVKLLEAPRPITKKDCGAYFEEYDGMTVANAQCEACLAKYLAWITGPKGSNWNSMPTDEERPFVDLSFRSTFNDEPGEEDLPRYKIEKKLFRVGVFTEAESNYFRLGEVKPTPGWVPLNDDRPTCTYAGCKEKALQKSAGNMRSEYYAGCTQHYSLPGMAMNHPHVREYKP